MSQFVDECRKEWKRLGVPAAMAEEMAADLTADLAEAEAEGASPEHVLGNGVFDARSFAASWATARGVVPARGRVVWAVSRSAWTLVAGAAVSLLLALIGLALVTGGHGSMSVAAVKGSISVLPAPFMGARRFTKVLPFPPDGVTFVHDGPAHVAGWILLAAGLVGMGTMAWLWRRWRPWSSRGRGPGVDGDISLPSYV